MEVPDIEVDHIETPSPLNPLGIKGAGEAGVIPVPALMAQALEDALSPWGVRVTRCPLNPGPDTCAGTSGPSHALVNA